MAEPYYLIDSNSVIDYLGNQLPIGGMDFMNDVIDEVANVSVITKMEVLGFNAPEEDYKILVEFMNDSVILFITEEIMYKCINIRRGQKIKLPDAILAATALAYDMVLVTRNTSDFKNIESLQIVNPHLL